MTSSAQVGAWVRSNPNQLLAVGLSVAVIAGSVWIGAKAKAAAAELSAKRAAWEQTSNQLATVQQQFRVPTATESAALLAESSRMGALGVPSEEKFNLVEAVGRLAEAAALRSIRVNAMEAPDSLFLPERSLPGSRIKSADYVLVVEFAGSFAGAVQFVSSLPPSVLVARMNAGQRGGMAAYSMILSVYELDVTSGN
jgi:hypothetical protein